MGDTEKKKVLFSVCKADAIPLTTPSLDDHIQTHGFEFCNMWMCPNYTYLNLLLQQLACESKWLLDPIQLSNQITKCDKSQTEVSLP